MIETATGGGSQAEVLVRALPHIQNYCGKTVVVKYGGNAMTNDDLKAAVMQDVVLMACVGIRTVLIHGGGPEIDAMLKRTGIESRFVDGLRHTDDDTMEIVQMVLCGKLNKDITGLIQQAGGRAVGLCGIDGAMLRARRIGNGELGQVGEIEDVDASVLNSALDAGFIPVVSPVAFCNDESHGHSLNVNADTAAAKIAAALSAENLVLMTDVHGILRDVRDPGSLIKALTRAELDSLKNDGTISEGMIPKVDCCALALDGGVRKASIIDGRMRHALLVELFTDEGIGTMLTRDGGTASP
ncbi:MAG: acetylglutamate kinase [Treponema sp.]|nr:acetylglutamate kinase [Treponema sp.]